MNRRRVARAVDPLSTLSGPLPPEAALALGASNVTGTALHRLRRLLTRLGMRGSVVLLSAFAILGSLAIVLVVITMSSLPQRIVPTTLLLSIAIPAVIAPPLIWLVTRLMFESENARRVAVRLAVTDPLTQAFNRRHFFHIGERAFAQLGTAQPDLSILLLDIDHFKAVNDEHGHALGDQVLKAVAQACMNGMREQDLLARFGGEEFVVLLPATGLVEAASVAERLRCAVESIALAGQGVTIIKPTVSIGVASRNAAAGSLDRVIALADRAMYAAKRAGRNRVVAEAPSA